MTTRNAHWSATNITLQLTLLTYIPLFSPTFQYLSRISQTFASLPFFFFSINFSCSSVDFLSKLTFLIPRLAAEPSKVPHCNLFPFWLTTTFCLSPSTKDKLFFFTHCSVYVFQWYLSPFRCLTLWELSDIKCPLLGTLMNRQNQTKLAVVYVINKVHSNQYIYLTIQALQHNFFLKVSQKFRAITESVSHVHLQIRKNNKRNNITYWLLMCAQLTAHTFLLLQSPTVMWFIMCSGCLVLAPISHKILENKITYKPMLHYCLGLFSPR